MSIRHEATIAAIAILSLAAPLVASAQTFPSKPSKIGCDFKASGPLPASARPLLIEKITLDADRSGDYVKVELTWEEPVQSFVPKDSVKPTFPEDKNTYDLSLAGQTYPGFKFRKFVEEGRNMDGQLYRIVTRTYSGQIGRPGIVKTLTTAGVIGIRGGNPDAQNLEIAIPASIFRSLDTCLAGLVSTPNLKARVQGSDENPNRQKSAFDHSYRRALESLPDRDVDPLAGRTFAGTLILSISAQGALINCQITPSFGSSAIEQRICREYGRWSYLPATNETGRNMFGTISYPLPKAVVKCAYGVCKFEPVAQ